jgi:hypothetical protein
VGSSAEESKMEIKVRDITPRMAKEWLARLGKNRKLRKNLVGRYVKQLKRGEWHLTHQGVAFDEKGELIDGQHRLQAIVESGITARMPVATGVGQAAKMVLDTGSARSFHDALTIAGNRPVETREVAAIRRFIRGTLQSHHRGQQETVYQIQAVMERYQKELDFVTAHLYPSTGYGYRSRLRHSAITAASMRALVHTGEKERIGQFLDVVVSGVTKGQEDQPAIALRDFLLGANNRNSPSTGTLKGAVEVYSKAERALRAFLDREALGLLKTARGDIFPPPNDLASLLKEEPEAEEAQAAAK